MSLYYAYSGPQQHPTPVHSHHGGRNRRAGRPATVGQSNQNSQNGAQNIQRLRAGRKDVELSFPLSNFRLKFEATRTFDLEDDLEFCPALLTDSDLESINSGSERSSLASNSPQSSPTQQPTSVAASFSLNSTSPSFVPPSFHHSQSSLKLHQPAATRTRNAIPIINPATGITMSSPPQSVSPSRMQQQAMQRRY